MSVENSPASEKDCRQNADDSQDVVKPLKPQWCGCAEVSCGFHRAIVALNLPADILEPDSSNYASARLDYELYRRS